MLGQLNIFVRNTASLIIVLLEYLLLFRAIMSWFPQMQGGKLFLAVYNMTEPIILPFRRLLQSIPALARFPLDLSFILAYTVLIFLEIILQRMI